MLNTTMFVHSLWCPLFTHAIKCIPTGITYRNALHMAIQAVKPTWLKNVNRASVISGTATDGSEAKH